ncbi:hypothetical protein RI367_007821 [Sorochytrium milnesiophthora]
MAAPPATTSLLTGPNVKLKVSSVLNKDTKSYGKQHLIDGSTETCWNSDNAEQQFIVVDFGAQVQVSAVSMTFQGGFVSSECELQHWTGNDFALLQTIYPDDINAEQRFELTPQAGHTTLQRLRILFTRSTDFYGRITMYKLDILGVAVFSP